MRSESTPVNPDAWDKNNPFFQSIPARNKRLAEAFQLVAVQLITFALSATGIALLGITSLALIIAALMSSFILMVLVLRNQKTTNTILGMNAGFFYLMLFSIAMGIMAGPALMMYAAMTNGPMLIAFSACITAAQTLALTIYASTTKNDFSYLSAFLSMMLMGLLVTNLLNFFIGSMVLDFASACVGIAVYSLYILVDVQQIQEGAYHSPYTAAMSLFLDIVNLFFDVLKVLAYVNNAKESKDNRFPSLETLPKLLTIFLVLAAVFGFNTRQSTPSKHQKQEENNHSSRGRNDFFQPGDGANTEEGDAEPSPQFNV